MRAVVATVPILTVLAWTVTFTADGLPQAAAFLISLFGTAVLTGLTIALAIDEVPRARLRAWGHHIVHPSRPLCSACHRTMGRVGDLLMCDSCDQITAELTA